MGKRVHVVKRQAEYGSSEAFNWCYQEFHHLLDLFGCDVCSEDEYSDFFECDADSYKIALVALKDYKKKGIKSKKMLDLMEEYGFDEVELEEYLSELGGIDEVIDAMECFWKERDKKSRWIQFSAF